jgi:hypothetical protein
MTEDTRAWRCACGARGTLAYETVSDEPDERRTFHCPKCGRELEDCRPTRRARRTPKNTADDRPIAVADPRALSDQEIARSGSEWQWTQQQLGNLGVLAESNWALDWAERLLREVRRLRAEVPPL